MKIQTKELIGDPLDWAVHHAYCEGACDDEPLTDDERYSTNWALGGPIIERESIGLMPSRTAYYERDGGLFYSYGPTTLIAAMRCYVASKLGDVVEVPDEIA